MPNNARWLVTPVALLFSLNRQFQLFIIITVNCRICFLFFANFETNFILIEFRENKKSIRNSTRWFVSCRQSPLGTLNRVDVWVQTNPTCLLTYGHQNWSKFFQSCETISTMRCIESDWKELKSPMRVSGSEARNYKLKCCKQIWYKSEILLTEKEIHLSFMTCKHWTSNFQYDTSLSSTLTASRVFVSISISTENEKTLALGSPSVGLFIAPVNNLTFFLRVCVCRHHQISLRNTERLIDKLALLLGQFFFLNFQPLSCWK